MGFDYNIPESKKVNIAVEYEPIRIRHLAIQCPDCEFWFKGNDIIEEEWVTFKYQLSFANCCCPKCGCEFIINSHSDISEEQFPEFYDKCLHKEERWV